jgi:hypothetical protein
MNKVEMKAVELNNDMEQVKKELKRIASIKCRLKKQKGKSTFEKEMGEAIAYENLLKEVRAYLSGDTPKAVPQYTQEDVDALSYDETVRAIKSIQSKKSLSKWLTEVEGDNDEYRNACKVEQMLRLHKETLQPTTVGLSKASLKAILERSEQLTKEELLAELQSLL